MPAPTTHTSQATSLSSAGKSLTGAVSVHSDTLASVCVRMRHLINSWFLDNQVRKRRSNKLNLSGGREPPESALRVSQTLLGKHCFSAVKPLTSALADESTTKSACA